MTALELHSNSTLADKKQKSQFHTNQTKLVLSSPTPDISTPPQSPNFPSTTLRLIQSQSLTSSTSSISSIDELEEPITYQAMNLVTPTLDASNSPETLTENSKEIVVSVLDDLISKQINSSHQEKNIELLKAKIQKNNQLLRENLKTSYQRFRLIQTKYFQTHVAQQLNNILELKEKQKQELSNSQKEVQLGEQVQAPKVVIDDGSVDLLTSILKSNLSDSTVENSENVDAAVKSLLDDIQYEILKQNDEKSKSNVKECVTDDDETEDDEDPKDNSAETTWKFTRDYVPVNPYQAPNDHINTQNEPQIVINSDCLTDSSNFFWSKSRAQLGSEWDRVQTKMKQLKLKSKQCNDYLSRTELFENYRMRSEITQQPPEQSENQQTDQAAIAALSTSLQESIAAEVFSVDTETASRCLPYDRSNRKSRIFNLSRSDLVELDDDVLKSFYYTLRYFSNTYFKTMCLCGNKEKQTNVKKTNYYYEKKRKLLEKESNCEAAQTLLAENGKTQADSLASRKTCIFCHLLKKYDQTRMETISSMTKPLQVNGQRKKKKNQLEVSMSDQANAFNSESLNQGSSGDKESNKNDVQSNSGLDSNLADVNVVNSDHSYCKQSSSLNINSTATSTNKKTKLPKTDASEELLDKLVGERLKRIFDGGSIKAEKCYVLDGNIESTEFVENDAVQDDELIDAGFDLSPDDLQNLPDLSYEELKFLNEMELDKFTYRQRLENSPDESDFSHSYASYFTKKSYSFPCQMTPEIFHALNYKPKYRSLFNKKYREQRKHDKLEFNEIKNSRKLEMKNRSRADVSKDKKLDDKVTRHDSISEKRSQTEISHSVRPRKRQRSTSSYSSNSSILSSTYNDSNYGDINSNNNSPCNQSSRSNNFYNYYCNAQNNKFDIDNIVIPYDMVNTSSKTINYVKQASVPTPKWREHVLDPLLNVTDEQMENLDDKNFLEMHQVKEKKFPDKSKKLKASNGDLSTSMPANLLSSCLNGKKKSNSNGNNLHEIDDRKLNGSVNITKQTPLKCEWLPRTFPLTESECEELLKQDQP